MESARSRTRKLIRKVLKTSDRIDSFMLDNFIEAWQQVASGMNQSLRINLLFEHYTVRQILERLEEYDTEKIIKKDLANFHSAELEDFIPSNKPIKIKTDPKVRARFRDFIILAFGGMLWEKLRGILNPVIRKAGDTIKSGRVATVTALAILLITVGVTLRDSQPPQLPSNEGDMQSSVEPRIQVSLNRTGVPLPPTLRPNEFKGTTPDAGVSLLLLNITPPKGSKSQIPAGEHSPNSRDYNRAPEQFTDASSEPTDMSTLPNPDLTQAQLPPRDLEPGPSTHPEEMPPEPSLLICPDRVAIQVESGSDTKVDQRRAAEQLILEMRSNASNSTKIVVLPNCSSIQAQGGSSSIQVSTTLMIQNRIIGVDKKCPVGSTKNCYDFVKRKIVCKFSFSITEHPAGYVCGKMKSAPPEYEITYFESELDVLKWTPSRRGDYALDKCRQLAGMVAQGNLCQPR